MTPATHVLRACLLIFVISGSAVCFQTRQESVGKDNEIYRNVIHLTPTELQARVISRGDPIYPPVAAWAGIFGRATVRILVNKDGEVFWADASDFHPLLRNAAATAAREWKIRPVERDGKPLKVDAEIEIDFSFRSESTDADEEADDGGLEKAKDAVKLFPNSPEAYFWLATEYRDDDQNKEAAKAFNTAIELKPDYQEAYQGLIGLYWESQATEDILRTFQKATDHIPNSWSLLAGYARALSDAKKYSEAVDVMKRAIELNPDDYDSLGTLAWDYMQLRRYDDALVVIKEQLKIDNKDATAYHNLGATYLGLKRYEDAISAYQKIITTQSSYQQLNSVYNELGWALMQSNRIAESIDAFNRAIDMKTDLPGLYCGLAAAYIAGSRLDEANEVLKKGLQERPKDTCIHYNLGILAWRIGKAQDAEPYFRMWIEANPAEFQGYANLASALMQQQKWAEAESILSQGIKKLPDNTTLRMFLSTVLTSTNKWAEAEVQFKEVLRLDPKNVWALNSYGYLLVERNERMNEALDMIQRAVDANPEESAFLDSLGWAYFKLGKPKEAESYLTKAVDGPYATSIRHEHLGDLYEKQGRRDLAVAHWQRALALKPSATDEIRLKAKLNAAEPLKQK